MELSKLEIDLETSAGHAIEICGLQTILFALPTKGKQLFANLYRKSKNLWTM